MMPNLKLELFDMWTINFMGLFEVPWDEVYVGSSRLRVQWVEAIALPNNKGKSVTTFLKNNIFSRFGTTQLSLVMVHLTFAIVFSSPYLRNMI